MSNQRKTGQGTRKGSTSKNTSSRAKTSKTIDNTYTKKRKEAAVKALSPEESSRRMEIYLFIYLAVAVFLLCSNFGWCEIGRASCRERV